MVKTNIKTTRYISFHKGMEVWVDIIDFGNIFEAWITPMDGGESELLFGIPVEQPDGENVDYEKFVSIVKENLEV